MAGKPIDIDISVNADDAEKGLSKVSDGLGDVQDSLKDLDKAGSKTADALGDDMSDAGKKIDRDLTQALEAVADEAKTTGKTVGREVREGTDTAGEGMEDLRRESASTATEAAASFGSIEDGADALQEVLANALGGFGPLGAAAGVGLAIGLGVAFTAMQEGADKATALQEATVELAGKIKDAGGDIAKVDIGGIISEWGREVEGDNWLTFWADESTSNFQKVAKQAKEAGVSSKDAIRGMKGSAEDSKGFLDGTQKEWESLAETIENGTTVTMDGNFAMDASAQAADTKRKALGELRKGAEQNIAVTEEAVSIYEIEKAATEDTSEAYKGKLDAIEAVTDSVKDSISAEHDYLDSVDELNKKLEENGATLDRTTPKGRENEKAVLDQAKAIEEQSKASVIAGENTDAVTAKFEAQKDTLVNQVMPAFNGSREKAQAYIDTILKTPPVATTKVLVDDQEARNKLDALTKARTAPLQILPDGTAIEKWYQSQQGRKIFVEFAPRGGGQAIAP